MRLILISIAMGSLGGCATTPLTTADNIYQDVNQLFGAAASMSALVVSVQTDILGKDNVRAPLDIRRHHEYISTIQRKRDTLSNLYRRVK